MRGLLVHVQLLLFPDAVCVSEMLLTLAAMHRRRAQTIASLHLREYSLRNLRCRESPSFLSLRVSNVPDLCTQSKPPSVTVYSTPCCCRCSCCCCCCGLPGCTLIRRSWCHIAARNSAGMQLLLLCLCACVRVRVYVCLLCACVWLLQRTQQLCSAAVIVCIHFNVNAAPLSSSARCTAAAAAAWAAIHAAAFFAADVLQD